MLFWTALGAIGGFLGAIATTAAVIVALWQTKCANRKKIKLSKLEIIKIVSNDNETKEKVKAEYVSIQVTNVGNRVVTLQNWGFKGKNDYAVILPDNSPFEQQLQPKLPHKLEVEESVKLVYSKDRFLKLAKKSCAIGAWNPNKPISIWVADTTGRHYYTKSLSKAGEYCKQGI